MKLYRLCWRIDGCEGHGEWHDTRKYLDSWLVGMNERFGEGTHWIEESA